MKLGVGFFQIRDGQAEVAFCGGEGAVAEEVLDVAEAGMVLDEMSSAAVAPDVRCDDLLDLGQLRVKGSTHSLVRFSTSFIFG